MKNQNKITPPNTSVTPKHITTLNVKLFNYSYD